MNFKDALAQDLATFINLEEFAEEVEINGAKLQAVVTRTSNKTASSFTVKNQISPIRHARLSGDFLIVYVRSCDLKTPRNGDFINVNGRRYKVESAEVLHGLLKIVCNTDRG